MRLRRLATVTRRLPSRARAGARRRPRLAIALTILAVIALVGGGVGIATLAATPTRPLTAATFTLRDGWTLTELQRHIENGEIDAITALPPTTGNPAGELLARTRTGQVVAVDLSVTAPDAVAALNGLGFGHLLTTEAAAIARPATGGPNFVTLIVAILVLAVTLVIIWRMSRRAASAAREGSSRFTTILPPEATASGAQTAVGSDGGQAVARVTLADVAGCDEAKLELTETIEFLRSPDRFRRLGARIPRGIMLFGPPGTGKTMLARAVAAEAGVPFHYASGSEFVEKYVGVGAKRVRDLFAQARKLGRGVIFFDEFDAIGKARGGPNSHEEREQTLNQLLVELDGFGSTDDVIVIAATNRLDVLDSAVLRPGRFNRKIHVGMPDVKGRRAILDVHARNKPLSAETDLEELARKTYGFSGAMLADLLNEAAILAARRASDAIAPEDLHAGWLKVAVGTSRRRSMDERERSIIAAHEVGHAICGKVHGDKRKVEEISLFAHGEALGVTVSSQEDNDLPSESDLRARLVALMGGRAAEEILFHEVTGGASNDFEAANRIATAMVTKWGMGRDPEAAEGGISGRGALSFLVPTGGRSLPSDVQAAATRAIRAILDEAYAEASRTLVAHLETLRRLAAYLVEHERVDGATFDELFDGRRPVANAEDEWRAAGARPRAWADVVDLADRRVRTRSGAAPSGPETVPPAPIPATRPVTAAIAPAPAPSSARVEASAPASPSTLAVSRAAPEHPLVTSVGSDPAGARPVGVDGADRAGTDAGDAFESAPATTPGASVPATVLEPMPRRRRPGIRRAAGHRARNVAASWLRRAERWVRPQLEADRL